MNLEKIGEFITELRTKKKFSIKELAKNSKTTEKIILALESGVSLPNIEEINRICKVLDITKTEFFKYKKLKNIKEDEEFLSNAIDLSCYLTNNKYKKIINKLLVGIFIGVVTILIYNNITNFYLNIKTFTDENDVKNIVDIKKLYKLRETILNNQGTYSDEEYLEIKEVVNNLFLFNNNFKVKDGYNIKEIKKYIENNLNLNTVYKTTEINKINKIIILKKSEMVDEVFKFNHILQYYENGFNFLHNQTIESRNYKYNPNEYIGSQLNFIEYIKLSSFELLLEEIIKAGDLDVEK